MFNLASDIRIQKFLLGGMALVTILVTPNRSLDAINLPKLLALSILALTVLGVLIANLEEIRDSLPSGLFLTLILFVSMILFAFLANGPNWNQVFGTYGRNSGLITFLGLSILMFAASLVAHAAFGKKLLALLVTIGFLNTVYGLIQIAGLDPVPWQSAYVPVVGTLGNPNFISAFLGMASTAMVVFVLSSLSIRTRALLSTLVVLLIFVVFKSNSVQGLAIFAISVLLLVYLRFIREKRALWKLLYLALVILLTLLGLLGIFQRGPLAAFLFENSIKSRGFYWGAAWNMVASNPITGVGLDNYGDYYRSSRSLEATTLFGADTISSSAHNYFLDFASFGGIPLLIAYLLLVAVVARSALGVLRISERFDPVGVGLIATWLAFIVQSIISPIQIGVAIWGWVIGGTIVGYERYLIRESEFGKDKREALEATLSPRTVFYSFLGFTLGLLVAIWPFQKDVDFARALESRNAIEIQKAALRWPQDSFYLVYASEIYMANLLYEQALLMASQASETNPRDFFAWRLIYSNPLSTEVEREEALAQMRILDPLNTALPDK